MVYWYLLTDTQFRYFWNNTAVVKYTLGLIISSSESKIILTIYYERHM